MQYGAEIFPYQRTRKVNENVNKRKKINLSLCFKLVLFFISAFLISRVLMINLMAPFGIAFLISTSIDNNNKIVLVTGCGTLLGYVSIYSSVKNVTAYFIIIATVVGIKYINKSFINKHKLGIIFASIFIDVFLYQMLLLKIGIIMAALNSLLEIACIFPIYFIINYSMICFKEANTCHLYSSEEIISMAITVSLIISGTWGMNVFGVSVRNFLAFIFIIIVAYCKGSAAGAACGVALGSIMGIATNDMVTFVGVYGLCGLIAGTFKEAGKWVTGVSYAVIFFILKMYSNIGIQFEFSEALIGIGLFYMIPNKVYKKIESELDWEKKQDHMKDNYADKIKGILVDKLNGFSDVLLNMSKTLEDLANNDKLEMKNKSSALIENLADRVCGKCNMKSICWKRESYYTYNAFGELIQNYQANSNKIPNEIERKCVKRTELIKNTEEILNKYNMDEVWRSRLGECREIVAGQINNMADSVDEIIKEFNNNIKFNRTVENDIRRILNKNKIKYKDVFCFNDKNDRLVIKLSMEACGGRQVCVKKVLPLINKATNKCMCVSDDGCNIDIDQNTCKVAFEEMAQYYIASYVSRVCKEGEKYNGDSYSFGKLKDGTYMTIISDGMGCGPQAGQESTATIELIDKFTKAGFSKITAINTVNSLMSIKFSREEKFSTLDINSVNLYTGQADFIKVGAVASFIKSKNEVDVIKSKTLPIGVLDRADVDMIKKQVKNGDMIVMVSDGILDYNSNSAGKVDWMVEYLQNTTINNPEQLCEGIVEKSKELRGGKINDDMTVVVSKVYNLF